MLILRTIDNETVEFTDKEANLSAFLNTMFYSGDETFTGGESKINIDTIVIQKANKKILSIVQKLCKYVLLYNLSKDMIETNTYTDIPTVIQKDIDISKKFTLRDLFLLIDIVNFMDIEIILQILKKKVEYMVSSERPEVVMELFQLSYDDFTEREKEAVETYNAMVDY